jgi:ABC-2 type transport system ATP-binding protein
MTNAIDIQGLTKYYGPHRGVIDLNLQVKSGEVFGYLGPNGAGKTTTIRCLLDLIRPSEGQVNVLGINPQADPVEVRAKVGYIPGEMQLEGNMTGNAVLRYLSSLRGRRRDKARILELADRLNVDLKRQIKNLSHGNKQKIGVIQALMHQPELLLMDEPTLGLDPLIQREVLQLVKEAQGQGTTAFFSSHIMSEVQAVADRVGIIRQGRIVEVEEVDALINRALRRVKVRFNRAENIDTLKQLPGVTVLAEDAGMQVWLQVAGEMDTLVKTLSEYSVSDIETERPSLEEIFLTYYETEKAEVEQ